jgi:hypothetical protein
VEGSLFDSDAFVEKVSERVFEKMKVFTGSLVEAQQAAAQIAQDMIPVDNTPPPPTEPIEPPPDQSPSRRHRMFAQPFKRS